MNYETCLKIDFDILCCACKFGRRDFRRVMKELKDNGYEIFSSVDSCQDIPYSILVFGDEDRKSSEYLRERGWWIKSEREERDYRRRGQILFLKYPNVFIQM